MQMGGKAHCGQEVPDVVTQRADQTLGRQRLTGAGA
jgi:hypothetical protein